MSKWVYQLSVAVAPEGIIQGHGDLRAGCHRLIKNRVCIFHIDVNRNGRSTRGVGSPAAHPGKFVGEEEA